jgi:hypothetical protein
MFTASNPALSLKAASDQNQNGVIDLTAYPPYGGHVLVHWLIRGEDKPPKIPRGKTVSLPMANSTDWREPILAKEEVSHHSDHY